MIGVDEVGRGAFAGPVVAGAAAMRLLNSSNLVKNARPRRTDKVILSFVGTNLQAHLNGILSLGINDSKKLLPRKREKLASEIQKYFYVGIGEASVSEINTLGIVKATERAMRRAIKALIARNSNIQIPNSKQAQNSKSLGFGVWDLEFPKQNIFVLEDAFHVKYIPEVGLKNQKGIIYGDSLSISIAAASIVAKVYRDGLMKSLSNKYTQYGWLRNKGYGTLTHRLAIKRFGITKWHRIQYIETWMGKLSYDP